MYVAYTFHEGCDGHERAPPGPMRQPDLFGVAEPPAPARYIPKREHILSPLNELLAAMRGASVWPWDAVQTDLKRNHVWPHLLTHLPADEAAEWRAALEAEAARLDAIALAQEV